MCSLVKVPVLGEDPLVDRVLFRVSSGVGWAFQLTPVPNPS